MPRLSCTFARKASVSEQRGLAPDQPARHASHEMLEHRFVELGLERIVGIGDLLADALLECAQLRLGRLRAGQLPNRGGPWAVPEIVEELRGFAYDGTSGEEVDVAKIGLAAHRKIMVADIAATDNGDGIVDDERLVVHAVIDAGEIDEIVGKARRAECEGIEQSHLDVAMGVEDRQIEVLSFEIDVVEEQAHAHAAIGGIE